MSSLPIRIRLMLWYCIFFSVAGMALSAASWFLLRQSLQSNATHELEERTDDIEHFLNALDSKTSVDGLRNALLQEYASKDLGKYLQVLDDRGQWLYFSDRRSIRLPISPLPPADEASGKGAGLTAFKSGKHRLQALSKQIAVHGRIYRISTALAVDQSQDILRSYVRILLLLTPALLIMAAAVGHILSRKALRPVALISEEARLINDRNLATRLLVPDTHDELSGLSQTLNQMLERIDVAFRSVRSFTANASHELRTPIALIRTRVEIALCFPRTAEQYRATLIEVQAATEHMTALLESMLTLARADAGAEKVCREVVDLSGLVFEAGQEWQDVASERGLRLIVNCSETQVCVLADATALRRLIRILLDNACRYTPSGGEIEISLEAAAGNVILAVADTGIGIEAEDLPRIFDRFYRVGGSKIKTVQQGKGQWRTGSGLGLSLAKWIADQHNATLSVTSKPAIGSRFELRLIEAKGLKEIAPSLDRPVEMPSIQAG